MHAREPRHACDFPATLIQGAAQMPVVVVNISRSGARLARAAAAEPGGRVVLVLAGGRHDATVQWHRHGRTGLRFDQPLSATVVATVRQVAGISLLRQGRAPASWRPMAGGARML